MTQQGGKFKLSLDEDRLFPIDPNGRALARELFNGIKHLPILSPHGHCDPRWFSENQPFKNPAELFVTPDHYVFRMLYSQGVALEELGINRTNNNATTADPRETWRTFASHYHLFRGTPSRLWIDYSFKHVFGVDQILTADNADTVYDQINECLSQPAYLPRALFDQFNIDALATTEGAIDTLDHHATIQSSDWSGRVVTTYRPDTVIDPDHPTFKENLKQFTAITGEDTHSWQGYLAAHRKRRQDFIKHGATASDHGHPTAQTLNLDDSVASELFDRIINGKPQTSDAELFRAQMLTEMAKMSLDDGLTMQIHPGSVRNHSSMIFDRFGTDKGFDIPRRTEYVSALKPLLDVAGHDKNFNLIIFTLDETSYGRELAPLAGVYPALKLGPAWWFFDSPDGMQRFREMTTETAGFYNTVGFNDDTRAFCSIPARHDVARRVDCAFLSNLVATGRLNEPDAFELAKDLTYNLAKRAYKL